MRAGSRRVRPRHSSPTGRGQRTRSTAPHMTVHTTDYKRSRVKCNKFDRSLKYVQFTLISRSMTTCTRIFKMLKNHEWYVECLVCELKQRREPEPRAYYVRQRVRVARVGRESRQHWLRQLPVAQCERTRRFELFESLQARHVPEVRPQRNYDNECRAIYKGCVCVCGQLREAVQCSRQ